MESFDTYAQRYESFNLSRVVLKLAQASKEQLSDAYSFCISHAKQHGHHILYKNLIDQANKKGLRLSSIADYDSDWVQKKEQEFRQEFSKKESELKLHIANNIKPSIQMSYLDLARLYIKAGDFNEFEQYATKSHEVQSQNTEANYYYKICLLLKQRIDDVKRIAENEIEQENYKNMASEMRTAYLHGRVILAITKMKTKDYFSAFNILSNIAPEYLPDIGIYTSFYDLSRYLAVLGVICYKREDIIERFHAETAKQLFHYNQNAVKLINGFVNANYEEATRALEKVMEELHEDSFLATSAESLRAIILEKLLKQYLSTISEVPIQTISEVFRLSEGECKTLLKNMILTQKIPFKIDSLRNVLVFQKKDEHSQSKLVKKALGIIGNYSLEKQFAILKVHYQAVSGLGKGKNKSAFDFLE